MRIALVTLTLFLLLFNGMPVTGQGDGAAIKYGQTVTGEITNANFEVSFSFNGTAEDIVVIVMSPVEEFGDLDYPAIILLSEDNTVLGTVESFFDDVIFATVLPADGKYTILATREDGRSGDSVGEFTLTLLKPLVLEFDSPISDTLTNEDRHFYVVNDLNSFTLTYTKTAGEFNPQLLVNVVDEYGLTEVTSLGGELVTGGWVAVAWDETDLAPPFYLVTLAEGWYDFNFDLVSADYTITLSE